MTDTTHAIELPKFVTRMPGTVRRAVGLEARTVIEAARAIVHCHLCGSPHGARANHFCPRLYGR